jgi:hypothetical protein
LQSPNQLGAITKILQATIWSIAWVKPCTLYQKAIRKQICITFKAQTSLGQSKKTSKLQLGGGIVVLKNGAILDG